MKELSTIGIDIAKNVFQVHGVDKKGKVILTKRLSRAKMIPFFKELDSCLIGIEACSGASYWGRELSKFGHNVKLLPPQYVKPYVKTNKNDYRDAEAICEAVERPNMRFAAIKTIEQQDWQCLHRIRERLIQERTKLGNQIRGFLREYGIVVSEGISRLKKQLSLILAKTETELTELSREFFEELFQELNQLELKIAKYDVKINRLAQSNEVCQRLQQIEGVGMITSTAIVAAISDAGVFKNGRQLAAWLGLVPRQESSGGKEKLLRISKRGNRYLRTLLVHGARSVLMRVDKGKDRRSLWLKKKKESRGFNKTCVALANRNARVIWALMRYGTEYQKEAV